MTRALPKRAGAKRKAVAFQFHVADGLMFASCLLAVPLLVLSLLVGDKVANQMHLQRIEAVRTSIDQELGKVFDQVMAVNGAYAERPLLPSKDQKQLDEGLSDLARQFNLPLLGLANQDGVMLSRTGSPRRGDYVFQTTPYGRRVAQGHSSVSVEAVRNYPLAIMAGVPIMRDQVLVGGFFGGHALDDAYAQAFQERYMKGDEEILFFARQSGLYGTSVDDPAQRNLLYAHLSRGSEWIQNPMFGIYPRRLQILEKEYRVGNIPLTSLDQDAGGAIVLFPVKRFRPLLAVAVGLILFSLLILHAWSRHRQYRWLFLVVGGCLILLSLTLGGLVYQRFFRMGSVVLGPSPFTVYNSTMALSPDSDVFDLTKQQRISIRIDSGGEEINAVQASVHYDADRMMVDDLLVENGICDPELIFEKRNDVENGVVTVACGMVKGFSGARGLLAEILFQPLKTGALELRFVTGTQVLANDGLGTNVLRSMTNGYYQVADRSSEVNKVLIFSSTHANQARWYNRQSVQVNWTVPTTSLPVAFAFDQEPDTVPDGTRTTRTSNITIPAREDGMWYFHLKTGTTNDVAHMRVMIDSTSPEPPVIRASATEVKRGEVVRFSFSGEDGLSGIQKNFYTSIDGGLWLPSLPSLYIPFLEAGEHEVRVRVFDQAENYRDSSITIHVK